jgi:glycolate oxidase FAD binding subunit
MTTQGLNPLAGAKARVVSRDETAAYEIDGIRPSFVAHPSDTEELSEVVSLAARAGLSVTPWGGGTHINMGNPPESLDVVVDLAGLNKVIDYPAADLTATVQAGVTFTELQKTLSDEGQWLAIDPPLPDLATVGGVLATGLSGPTKWQYWSPRDVVIGMKIVQPDGVVTKSGGQVVKNVSGYDMSRIHIGGLGTLGIIAEVSLKLTPLPRQQVTLVASYDSAEACIRAALDVFHSNIVPLAITAFDKVAARRIFDLNIGSYTLAVRLGSRPKTLDRQQREMLSALESAGSGTIEAIEGDDAARLWRSLADFAWDEATRPLLGVRATVTPSACAELVQKFERLTAPYGTEPAVVSHPAHGTVLACWYPDGELSDSAIANLASAARNVVEHAGGRLVVEHAPVGTKNLVDVWGEPAGPIDLLRRFKERYDPHRLLNPGRFVGGI